MHGHPDRPRLVGERAGDGLADPPGRVGRELEALAVVELLGRAHEPDRPLLDQVEERQALVAVALGDRDDEAEVGLDHLLLRAVVAALDPLRELDLLGGGQQVDLADVLEEELQRVGRDLARLGNRRCLFDLYPPTDDLDLQLLECLVELVDLRHVEIQLVQRARDLVCRYRTGQLRRLEQPFRFIRLEDVYDTPTANPYNAHLTPPSPRASLNACDDVHESDRCGTLPVAADTPPWAVRLILGSFGPSTTEPCEQAFRLSRENRRRRNGRDLAQLDPSLAELVDPDQRQPQAEPDGGGARKAADERPELGGTPGRDGL